MTLASRTDAEFSRDIESHVDAAIAGVQGSFDSITEEIRGLGIAPCIQGHLREAETFFRKFMLWEKLHWAPLSLKQRAFPMKILSALIKDSYPSGTTILTIKCPYKVEIFGNNSWIQMMMNSIIENAVLKTAAESEIRIDVFVKSDKVAFEFSYQGEPVPEEEIPFLFNPFPEKLNAERPSLNMALATAGIVVKRHKGEVSHSQEGLWTKINITLPIAATAPSA